MIWEVVVGYLSLVYSIVIHTLCFKKCSKNEFKVSKTKTFFLIALCSLINMGINFYIEGFIHVFITILLFILLFKVLFKRKLNQTLLITLEIVLISLIVELVLTIFLSFIFPNVNTLNSNLTYKTIITFLFSTIFYFIISLPIINEKILKISDTLSKNITSEFILGFAIAIINILSAVYGDNYKDYKYLFIITISIFSIFILITFIFYLLFKKKNAEIETTSLNNSIAYYEVVADEYGEVRHNLINDLLAVKSLTNEVEVQNLLDEIITKYQKNYNWSLNMSKVPKGIQSLIYLKLNTIKKAKINFEINSHLKNQISNIKNMKNYSKLCTVVGIVIDNAIEASGESKEKSMLINIEEKGNQLFIQIINTFANEINLNKIGNKNYSTKNRNSGRGLNYINKIRCRNIKVKKEIINNLFIVNIKYIR